jgi:hypothetical protein
MVSYGVKGDAMSLSTLTSNAQLFAYLRDPAEGLRRRDEADAAETILLASRFASGSASEFLHESHLALKKVRSACSGKLTPSRLDNITSVIEQIEEAFRHVGGV